MDLVRASKRAVQFFALATLMFAAGCSTNIERQLAEAEALRLEAAAAGGEWLQTESLLQQAREEADRGNTEAALSLIAEARFQAEAAIRQAEHESVAWRDRVVR